MKVTTLLAFAAAASELSLAAPTPLADPAPQAVSLGHRVKQPHKRSLLEVTVLGGNTFRAPQVVNPNFIDLGFRTGPAELFRAYSKFGVFVNSITLEQLLEILRQLGLEGLLGDLFPGGGGNNDPGNGNGNDGGEMTTPDEGGNNPVDFNDPNFNGTLPDDLDNGDSAGDVDAIPDTNDKQFLCPVQIGNPPQTLNLNFDTGSSDLWVFSSLTPVAQTAGHTLYDPSQSSTSVELDGQTWEIRYGDGSGANGVVFRDTVTIGGITVEDQAVELATNVSQSFASDEISDGLVGLAFSSINTVTPTRQLTFWENALETLAMPLFSANLKAQEPGNYNFGFIDPTEFSGEITFIPVNSTGGFWEFNSPGFKVGSTASTLLRAPHQAIADTGTTLLLLPDDIVAAYYAQVPGAVDNTATVGGWTFPCDATLPDYIAIMGDGADGTNDYEAIVPGEFINFAVADTFGMTCFGGIQATGGLPFAIYGGVFLKNQFVVFHGGESQLGLAAKASDA